MRKVLTLSAFLLLLVASFSVVGCNEESCKDLYNQLESLQNQIIELANKRRDADSKGDDMSSALELYQQEVNARNNFEQIKNKYEARGCVERTGDAPSLPPFEQISETQFE